MNSNLFILRRYAIRFWKLQQIFPMVFGIQIRKPFSISVFYYQPNFTSFIIMRQLVVLENLTLFLKGYS